MITGDWDGNWQSYVGAALGGAVGGVMLLSGGAIGACALDSGISTLLGESMENITGAEQRSFGEVWFETVESATIAAVFSCMFSKGSDKLARRLSSIDVFRRLAGIGSYGSSFHMVLTKLMNGTIKHFTFKTIRNGIVSELSGSIIENILSGLYDGTKERYAEYSTN